MASINTITYNGSIISEIEESEDIISVSYDNTTIASLGIGETKTFNCNGKVMKTNLYIGAKTLLCEMSKMISDVIVAVKSAFPEAPSAYSLIGKYTSNTTWTAPEDGYFQIEVFGASGKGGKGARFKSNAKHYCGTGGGGGGGGYACSRIKMNKGDTVAIVCGAVGATSSATINSSFESYKKMQVTGGTNGSDGVANSTSDYNGGAGGTGGKATGGNYKNANGGSGGAGKKSLESGVFEVTGGSGGAAGQSGGNKGGAGGLVARIQNSSTSYSEPLGYGDAGSKGFIKIYRGNTNVDNGSLSGDVVFTNTDGFKNGTFVNGTANVNSNGLAIIAGAPVWIGNGNGEAFDLSKYQTLIVEWVEPHNAPTVVGISSSSTSLVSLVIKQVNGVSTAEIDISTLTGTGYIYDGAGSAAVIKAIRFA